MATSDLRQAYFEILMEQVRSGQYPSPTMMERLEKAIRDRGAAEEYAQLLLDTISEDRYPSPQMLERINYVINILESLDAMNGSAATNGSGNGSRNGS